MENEIKDEELNIGEVSKEDIVQETVEVLEGQVVDEDVAEEEQDLTLQLIWQGMLSLIKNSPVTMLLVLINIIVFIVLEIGGSTLDGEYMLSHGAMNPALMLYEGQWYRLITAMFMHFGGEHLFNNMLLLICIGRLVEKAVGSTKFLSIYLLSGFIGGFVSFFWCMLNSRNNIVCGASGAIFGIVGAMIIVIIVHKGRYEGITAKQIILMALLILYFGFVSVGTDNAGHVGGLIWGVILTLFIYGIPYLIKHRKNNIIP